MSDALHFAIVTGARVGLVIFAGQLVGNFFRTGAQRRLYLAVLMALIAGALR